MLSDSCLFIGRIVQLEQRNQAMDNFIGCSGGDGGYGAWGNALNVPAMRWHSLRSLESGTVLFECKDGKWEKLGEGDVRVLSGQ